MAQIVDSYSESNINIGNILAVTINGLGQSFTGDGGILNSSVFSLKKSGTITGNAYSKIYAHSGTFGTNSIPTGSPLAISDAFDVSTLTTSNVLKTFTFTGSNKINLDNGTHYVVTVEYSGGDGSSNYAQVGGDNSSPTAAGNESYHMSSWTSQNTVDLCFYVYKDDVISPTITTQAISSISYTTATGNGNVTSDGGATVTERGVCWNTSTGPTTANSKATTSGTTGAYTVSMTGLTKGTLYYAKAYAINSVGTSYGSEVTFTTLSLSTIVGLSTISNITTLTF